MYKWCNADKNGIISETGSRFSQVGNSKGNCNGILHETSTW